MKKFSMFQYDTKDHKNEESLHGIHMQFPMLRGPTGIAWQIEPGYSESSRHLCDVHRETAFEAAIAIKNWPYARYLGLHLPVSRNARHNKTFKKVLSKTRWSLTAGTESSIFIDSCREFLTYLGELHVQIVRAIENGVILISEVQDLRTANIETLRNYLNEQKVPITNERNPYQWTPFCHTVFHNKWMHQNDEQINNYHKLLGCPKLI